MTDALHEAFVPPEVARLLTMGQTHHLVATGLKLFGEQLFLQLQQRLERLVNLVQPLLFLLIGGEILLVYLQISYHSINLSEDDHATQTITGFTLIEVIAALGVIILLTLALVLTIQGQMKRVESQNLKATVATVNSQIEMAYNEPDADKKSLKTIPDLVREGVITDAQAKDLEKGKATMSGDNPPKFKVP